MNLAAMKRRLAAWLAIASLAVAAVQVSTFAQTPAGPAAHGYLGLSLLSLSREQMRVRGLPGATASLIIKVAPGSPADEAGLKPGEILLEIGGKPAGSEVQVLKALAGKAPGTEIRVVLFREGRQRARLVKLGVKPVETLAPALQQPAVADTGEPAPQTAALVAESEPEQAPGQPAAIHPAEPVPSAPAAITQQVAETPEAGSSAAHTAQATAQIGHNNGVNALAISRDGRFVLSGGGSDGMVKLWDVQAHKELRSIAAHAGGVLSVAFSADGRLALSGGCDAHGTNPYYCGTGSMKLWDAATGKEVRKFAARDTEVRAVAFSPDGGSVLSGGCREWDAKNGTTCIEGTVRLWDAASGEQLRSLRGHSERVMTVAFSPDGRTILSGSYDSTLKQWDAATGRELHTLSGHKSGVYAAAFSPDGRMVLSGSWDGTLRLWDTATGSELRIFEAGEKNLINAVAFSPDGRLALSGSDDTSIGQPHRTLMLWEVATGKLLRTLTGPNAMFMDVRAVAFSPDGRIAYSAGYDSLLRYWDLATGEELEGLRGQAMQAGPVTYSPDGQSLLGLAGKWVLFWDAATGKAIRSLAVVKQQDTDQDYTVFSPNRRFALVSNADEAMFLLDVNSGRMLHTGHSFPSGHPLALSPNGRIALFLGETRGEQLQFLDMASGTTLNVAGGYNSEISGGAFSPDGRHALAGSFHPDGSIKMWDASNGGLAQSFAGHKYGSFAMAFSPDGRLVVSCGHDDNAVLWDVATGAKFHSLSGHTAELTAAAFSPDGRTVLTGSKDETLKLWDVATGRLLRTFSGHMGEVSSAGFSADGKYAVSASEDRTIRIWDVRRGVNLPS